MNFGEGCTGWFFQTVFRDRRGGQAVGEMLESFLTLSSVRVELD